MAEYTVEPVGGILGFWHRDGEPADAAVLARMSAALRHRGPDGEARWVAQSVCLVQERLDAAPRPDGPAADPGPAHPLVLLDGRLHDRDDLVSALGLPPLASDAACVAGAYRAWGEACVERLNGDFAIAIFDPRTPRLLLVRDAIGVRPLYYFCDDRLIAFGSEIKAVLAHPRVPRAPCDDGLADFLLLGSRPIDRQEVTCFAGIHAVVPAHVCEIRPDRVSVRRYWDFDPALIVRLRSFDEYADAFRERFERAVERRVRSACPVAVSVSGGFDSSSIFCQIETLRRGRRPHIPPALGVSYFGREGTDADERRYLLEIEREYGVVVDRFPMEPLQGLIGGAADQIQAIEAPFLDYMWGVTRELHARASSFGARTLLTGAWGDQVLFSSAYLADLFGRLRCRTILQHLAEYRRWFGGPESRFLARRFVTDAGRHHLPAPALPVAKWLKSRLIGSRRRKEWFSSRFLRMALRFADQPVRLPHRFHSAHARSIYLEARSKYHVHCLEWNDKVAAMHGMTAAFPFLDRELVQFLMAVPGDVQNRHGVPRALAREGLRGVLPPAIRERVWKADFSAVVNAGVSADAAAIKRILSRDALSVAREYVDADRLDDAVDRLTAGGRADCAESWDVADLVGLEVWLQVFFGAARQQTTHLVATGATG